MPVDQQLFTREVEKLRRFSAVLFKASEDQAALVQQLNSLSPDSRKTLATSYQDAGGPVTRIRKQVAEILVQRNIELQELSNIIDTAVGENPDAFRMYKTGYSMLYMFLIADFRTEMHQAINYISSSILEELDAGSQITARKFDFTGERETGSTRCWIAFFNASHPKQNTAKQLFLNIQNGTVEFSLYDRPEDAHTDLTVIDKDEKFDAGQLLDVFLEHKNEILGDVWVRKTNYWRIGTTDNTGASFWEEMKTENKICIGWAELGDLRDADIRNRKSISGLLSEEGFYEDDNRVRSTKAGEIFKFYERMQPGDIVLAQKGDTVLGIGRITGDYSYNDDSEFPHQRPVEWLKFTENAGMQNAVGRLTTVYQIEDDNVIKQVQQMLNTPSENMTPISSYQENQEKIPLNQILYGPPGTGKTYHSINRALQIINDQDLDWNNRKFVKEVFDKKTESGQIAFITFHQSISYEDFIEGIKPDTNARNEVIYGVKPGLFKTIATAARNNWLDTSTGRKGALSFEDAFAQLKSEWELQPEMKFPLKTPGYDYQILDFTETSIRFKKSSGGTGHTLSINTLSDYFYNRRAINPTGVGIYYPSILEKLRSYKPSAPVDTAMKNYVLIIDEINRGNVSRVFGELITLIEEDKRLGRDEALEATLPYSHDRFGVPPNLYIIGTMNTADRSVEALDAALRRRFSFEEMPPEPDTIEPVIEDISLKQLLLIINTRIEKLLDKDHQIGHSYFMKVADINELQAAFYNKIIPLLQEYFFGSYDKIGLVLGSGFVRLKSDSQQAFADFDTDSAADLEERPVYETIDYRKQPKPIFKVNGKDEEMNFLKALKLLMRTLG